MKLKITNKCIKIQETLVKQNSINYKLQTLKV